MSDIISFQPVRALDSNGNPVAGAEARFFRSGTTTPATVFQDVAEQVPHPVPVVANGAGVFPAIYRGGQALRVVVTTPAGVTLPGFPLDPVITVPAQGGAAGGVSFDPTPEIPVTNVQAAIERVQLNLVAPLLAGGIGVTGNAPILNTLDATDTASGFYRWTDVATGTFPPGWSGETGTVWLFRENVNNAVQFIARRDIDALYTRRLEGGIWLDWARYDAAGAIASVEAQVNPRLTGNTTTRQTVLTGPVDSNGRANFLAAGTGLQVVATGVGADPLNITFGDGFADGEQRNFGVSLDSVPSWDGLPNSEDAVFLFIRVLPDGTVETFHSLLPPVYAQVRPSAPATGQTFYPTDHRHRMEVWDGAEWNRDNLIICVGQCATSGGAVVSAVSYAYQGCFTSDWINGGAAGSLTNVAHNIGVREVLTVSALHKFISAAAGYAAGEVIDVSEYAYSSSTNETGKFLYILERNAAIVKRQSRTPGLFIVNRGSSSNIDVAYTNFDLQHSFRRAF